MFSDHIRRDGRLSRQSVVRPNRCRAAPVGMSSRSSGFGLQAIWAPTCLRRAYGWFANQVSDEQECTGRKIVNDVSERLLTMYPVRTQELIPPGPGSAIS
jgi:hypothetical protein